MQAFVIDMNDKNRCLGTANFDVLPDVGDSLSYKWRNTPDEDLQREIFVIRHRRFVAVKDGRPAGVALWCQSEAALKAEMEIQRGSADA